jgi:hypothetical protein
MLRAFLIEPASSRGPYDDETTVTQGVVVYNLHMMARQPVRKWGNHCYSEQ